MLAAAGAWALHVVLIGAIAPRRDPTALVGVQFAAAAVLSAGVSLALEPVGRAGVMDAALAVGFAGVFATGVAFSLQFHAQREAPPTHATVLMSTEAVFAAFFGWLLLGEHLGPRELGGGALMLAGVLAGQLIRPRGPSPASADPTPAP